VSEQVTHTLLPLHICSGFVQNYALCIW